MQKIASAIIIALIALVAVVFGLGALSTISADAVAGTPYEGTFDIAQTLSSGAIPILLVVVLLMVVGALILALRKMQKAGRGRGYNSRRGY